LLSFILIIHPDFFYSVPANGLTGQATYNSKYVTIDNALLHYLETTEYTRFLFNLPASPVTCKFWLTHWRNVADTVVRHLV